MHRSGTSALAGVLDELGVYGGKDMMDASYDNPKGFFENASIVEFNEALLLKNNTSWFSVMHSVITWDLIDTDKAKNIVAFQYGSHCPIYIKDPRCSLLLDFWTNLLEELGYEICHIFCGRRPERIIDSLSKRNNFSRQKSIALIQKYWTNALSQLIAKRYLPIGYENLVSDPESVIDNIESYFSIKLTEGIDKTQSIDSTKKALVSGDKEDINTQYLNSIYDSIFKNPNNVNREYDLKDLISNPPNINIDEIRKLELSEPNFCKLFFDIGDGYNEADSLTYTHNGKALSLVEEFRFKNVRAIQILPLGAKCNLIIASLKLFSCNESISFSFKTNSSDSISNQLVFSERPMLNLQLEKQVDIDNLRLDIKFLDEIDEPYKPKLSTIVNSRASLLWQSILLFITKPMAFLSQLNAQNFRTLKSALRRENPQTIYRNLKKLIQGENLVVRENSISFSEIAQIENDKSSSILYVTGEVPQYDRSSGAQRAEKILSILADVSNVLVLYNKAPDAKYLSYYQTKGIKCVSISELRQIQKDIAYNLSSIIYNKYYTYHDFKEVVGLFPYAKTVIDAEDVAWLRESRSINYTDLSQNDVERNKRNEIAAYNAADHIWCVTSNDKKELETLIYSADISIVSNIHDLESSVYSVKNSKGILFFANYSHEPNVSALKVILSDIFPLIRKELSSAILYIAGSSMELVDDLIPVDSQIEKLSYVESDKISDLYDSVELVIAPLLFGSGIKGKITEAIKYRVPVITNAIGNEGIDLVNEVSGFITEDFSAMAEYAIDIFNGKFDIESITKEAIKQLQPIVGVNENTVSILNCLFPKISICIVTYNRVDLLRACVESIYARTSYANYDILIYSNGCSDGTVEYLKSLESSNNNVKVVYSDKNEVFVIPNNKLMQMANSNDVVLLNNDVLVKRDWLTHLCHAARFYNEAGVIGSRVLYPDGRLQEYGSEIYVDGTGHNIGKEDDIAEAMYNKVKTVPYVSGCCMYIKRSTISEIGMFDEDYSPCYYEDSDYCYRAWQSGMTTIVTPLSELIHHEGASAGTDETNDSGFKKYQLINKEKFLLKHKDHIAEVNWKARKKLQSNW